MTIPKRLNEVLEEQTSYNVSFTVRNTPIQWKTGGVSEDGIIVEAIIDNTRVGALMAANDGTGNHVLDTIIVAPEYRRRGIAMNMMHKAHASVPMLPYYLTPDPVYKSEAGRQLVYKELSIYGNGARPNNVRTAGPLLAVIPEAIGVGADLLGGATAAGAAESAAAIPSIGAAGVASSAAAPIAADVASSAAAPIASDAAGIAADAASGSKGLLGNLTQRAKGLWTKLPSNIQKGVQFGAGSEAAQQTLKPNPNSGNVGSGSSVTPSMGPYGGGGGGGGAFQVGRMLGSKQANPTMQDVPKLLELILETMCGCGQPSAGKFNGMPHCIPGTGCSGGVGRDACCSCGDENAAGTFHGSTVCAPGQGCNDHWQPGVGRKWNPSMETPSEKISDHDNWAMSTNHGETEMPHGNRDTTWEI